MTITVGGKKLDNLAKDHEELKAKRAKRDKLKTKYWKNNACPEGCYKGIQVFLNGQEVKLSSSALFVIEHLIADLQVKKE